ncbi:hypothetical protein ACIU1J_01810 [Azospirillum doebereinerae]|uniref:hypothetical protein n=1 Tax=Azospirillum doebereinerae TaxID=92933 RepID=UPI001EE59CA6|nr:hypothetical protein [Azospirillum doebereinerae]MCG5240067.1 hypothetical protein [Azospirillum doebereinerae]
MKNRQNDHMSVEQDERDRLRTALLAFFEEAKRMRKIRSVRAWVTASEIGYNTLNDIVRGKRNKRLEDETYFALAMGATKLLGREVTVAELQGISSSPASELSDADAQLLADLKIIGNADEGERQDLEELIRKRAQAARARLQPEA